MLDDTILVLMFPASPHHWRATSRAVQLGPTFRMLLLASYGVRGTRG